MSKRMILGLVVPGLIRALRGKMSICYRKLLPVVRRGDRGDKDKPIPV